MRQAKPLPLPRSRKHGSGAESADYGRFGEGRGRAPEGERAPTLARFRARAQVSGDTSLCGADSGRHAPFGAPLPSLLRMILSENRTPLFGIIREPGANLLRCLQTSGAERVARTQLLTRPRGAKRSGGGGPCGAWWRGRPAQMNDPFSNEIVSLLTPLPPRKCAVLLPHLRGGG